MLLESALAEFSELSTRNRRRPSVMPFVWDDKPGNKSLTRSLSYSGRVSGLSVQENEGLHLHEEAADMFNARQNQKGGGHTRNDSGQFYHKEGTVPFKWEAAPGKPAMIQETTTNFEAPRLRPPPAFRNVTIPAGGYSPRQGGIAGKVKSILSAKVSKSTMSSSSSNNSGTVVSDDLKFPTEDGESEQWSSISGREDTDKESSLDSDGGEESSPVSTLDRPASPDSPVSPGPDSPKNRELAIVPATTSTTDNEQINFSVQRLRNLSRNDSWKHIVRGANTGQQSQTGPPFITMTEFSEELPIIEEDEEDEEFHTMEFTIADNHGTIEERRERSLTRRPGSSKSMSAPLPRRQSSLGDANRQRRRSDFDWPEDYEDKPEEVVKEVDESLWAFSPVSSNFVFSGNDHEHSGPGCRSPGRGGTVVTGTSTPTSARSGSIRETLSLRRTLMRSSSTRNAFNGKSSAEAAAAHAEFSSQTRQDGRVKSRDDDELYKRSRSYRLKRSLSCIPFLNLCRAHRPGPSLSFSSRLSTNIIVSKK